MAKNNNIMMTIMNSITYVPTKYIVKSDERGLIIIPRLNMLWGRPGKYCPNCIIPIEKIN